MEGILLLVDDLLRSLEDASFFLDVPSILAIEAVERELQFAADTLDAIYFGFRTQAFLDGSLPAPEWFVE